MDNRYPTTASAAEVDRLADLLVGEAIAEDPAATIADALHSARLHATITLVTTAATAPGTAPALAGAANELARRQVAHEMARFEAGWW